MEQTIIKKLCDIEAQEHVRILFAAESGSRAWGFPSPDSDYDVRFIYIRQKEEYLRLDKTRDVLEFPLDGGLDISGWDLQKTLRLIHKSNPTVFEWFSSPLVYMETSFAETFRQRMGQYFSPKKSLYHYIHMAKKNRCEYLGGSKIKVKKYFYVLRSVLACKWILEKGTPPPMLFGDLMQAELPKFLLEEVKILLDFKQNSPEVKTIEKVEKLHSYLDTSIEEIHGKINDIKDTKQISWQELNELFQQQIQLI